MAGTVHLQIRNAIHALLTAAVGLTDGGVLKGKRKRPMAAQFYRQVHVFLDASPMERGEYGSSPDTWDTRIRIECCARADAVVGFDGEENADELAKEVYALVLADPGLGGLLSDLKCLAIAWDTEEADDQVAVAQLAFDAMHRTLGNSIAA